MFSFGVLVIFIGIMLSVFQQFVGINVVLYYATDIFKGMGMTTNASLFQTIIVGAVNLTFTVVAIVTVDHFGRRPLQIIGALVMAVSMIALGTDFWLGGKGMVALVCHAGLYRWICRVVGAGDLGAFERDLSQPDSRQGYGSGGGDAVDRQLSRQLDIPDSR